MQVLVYLLPLIKIVDFYSIIVAVYLMIGSGSVCIPFLDLTQVD